MSSFLDPNFSGQLFKESPNEQIQKKKSIPPFLPQKKKNKHLRFPTKKIFHQKTPPPSFLPSFPRKQFSLPPQEPSLQKLRRPEASICMCQRQGAGRRRWNGHQGGLTLDVGHGRWAAVGIHGMIVGSLYIYRTIHVGKIYHTSMQLFKAWGVFWGEALQNFWRTGSFCASSENFRKERNTFGKSPNHLLKKLNYSRGHGGLFIFLCLMSPNLPTPKTSLEKNLEFVFNTP